MGIQKSEKGIEYINIQVIDPAPQGWLGHKPAYKELPEGADESEREIDFEKTPVLPITRLQAERMIRRGQAVKAKVKPKKKTTRAPANKRAAAHRTK